MFYYEIITEIDGTCDYLVERHRISAMAVGLVKNDVIIWHKGYSNTSHDQSIDLSNKKFPIQSVTKTYTALAFLLAVQDGLVSLDESIANYLAGFALYYDGRNRIQEITFRHLLSHRSGLQHEAPVGNNYEWAGTSFEEHIKSIDQTLLKFVPGKSYSYSNLGYDLVGYILSQIYGKPFELIMQEHVFDKLGMDSSSFDLSNPMMPSSGMCSTVMDMSKFLMMILVKGMYEQKQYLCEELLEEMMRIQSPMKDQISGYGLGVKLCFAEECGIHIHIGSGFGYYASQMWTYKYDLGFILLCDNQSASFINDLNDKDAFYNVIVKLEAKDKKDQIKDPNSAYPVELDSCKRYVGSYLMHYNRLMYCMIDNDSFLVSFDEKRSWQVARFVASDKCVIGEHLLNFRIEKETVTGVTLINHYQYEFYPRNDSIYDEPGSIDESCCERYIGRYKIKRKNKLTDEQRLYAILNRVKEEMKQIEVMNGYLYLNGKYRLIENEGGLLIKVNGETIQFLDDEVRIGNVPYSKIDK
ncbi:MAG: beta-lactamase family protein [Halanaerobiales bacterium]|nr:beta-lactamase family protein [Halanaerobiales bacterium]